MKCKTSIQTIEYNRRTKTNAVVPDVISPTIAVTMVWCCILISNDYLSIMSHNLLLKNILHDIASTTGDPKLLPVTCTTFAFPFPGFPWFPSLKHITTLSLAESYATEKKLVWQIQILLEFQK